MPDTMIQQPTEQPSWQPGARSPTLGAFFAAVAKAQGEIEGAKKDSTNPHFKSQYADLASARDAVQGPLSKNELALVQWPRTVDGGVEIETWLGHASGEFMSGVLWMPCKQMDAHGVGSAITYGRRYALMAVTGVAPIDDDGNGAVDSHRPGPIGSASSGTDFRPPGPRRQSSWGDGGKQGAVDEAERDGLTKGAKPKPLPGAAAQRQAMPINTPEAAGSAIKRIAWVKESVAFLRQDGTDEHIARDWWAENKARVDVIETALPTEYERLLDAYNEALERKAPA